MPATVLTDVKRARAAALCAFATLSALEKAAKPVADPRECFLPPRQLLPDTQVVLVAVRHVGVEFGDEPVADFGVEDLDGDFEVVEPALRVEVVAPDRRPDR